MITLKEEYGGCAQEAEKEGDHTQAGRWPSTGRGGEHVVRACLSAGCHENCTFHCTSFCTAVNQTWYFVLAVAYTAKILKFFPCSTIPVYRTHMHRQWVESLSLVIP